MAGNQPSYIDINCEGNSRYGGALREILDRCSLDMKKFRFLDEMFMWEGTTGVQNYDNDLHMSYYRFKTYTLGRIGIRKEQELLNM